MGPQRVRHNWVTELTECLSEVWELNTEWCLHWCVLSHFSNVRLFVTLWTIAHQAPVSMGFSRQEYWSGLPCSPPGDLPNREIRPESPPTPELQADYLLLSHQGRQSDAYLSLIGPAIPLEWAIGSSGILFAALPGPSSRTSSSTVGLQVICKPLLHFWYHLILYMLSPTHSESLMKLW